MKTSANDQWIGKHLPTNVSLNLSQYVSKNEMHLQIFWCYVEIELDVLWVRFCLLISHPWNGTVLNMTKLVEANSFKMSHDSRFST